MQTFTETFRYLCGIKRWAVSFLAVLLDVIVQLQSFPKLLAVLSFQQIIFFSFGWTLTLESLVTVVEKSEMINACERQTFLSSKTQKGKGPDSYKIVRLIDTKKNSGKRLL